MNTEDINNKNSKLIQELNNISSTFGIAEDISGDFTKHIEAKNEIIKTNLTEIVSNDVFDVLETDNVTKEIVAMNTLQQDFQLIRETLLETIQNGRQILNALTDGLLMSGEDISPDMLESYSILISSVNTSTKLLSSSYKDVFDTQIKIMKLVGDTKKEESSSNNTTTNNILITTTGDFIKKFKK
jgi:hypothetical protein